MRKINLKKEKIERNKAYAKRFEKTWEQKQRLEKESKKDKSQGGKWGKWCRTAGHLSTCSCTYPTDVSPGTKRYG